MKQCLKLLSFFFSLFLVLMPVQNAKSQSNVDYVLENAEAGITRAFKALRVAELNGADTSTLISRLNDAVLLLDEAKISYSNEDFEGVQRRASESSLISSSIEAEAMSLADQALQKAEAGFRMLILYTFAASSIMLAGLFVAWRFFKAYYKRRILEAKPEVLTNEP